MFTIKCHMVQENYGKCYGEEKGRSKSLTDQVR